MNAFPEDWFQAASATANLVFAFNFQFNFFPIYKGMQDVTDSRMKMACLSGLIGCAVPYLTVGFIGFSMVGIGANANFLESIAYSETNPFLFYVINISYLFTLPFAIVLLFFGARNNFINIVNRIRKKKKKKKASDKLLGTSGMNESNEESLPNDWKAKRREKADK